MTIKEIKDRFAFLCMTCTVIAFIGCNRDNKNIPSGDDFARCVELVNNCRIPAPANVRYKLFKKTFDDVAAISNVALRVEMAKKFAGLANTVNLELQNDDYAEFADRVSRYKTMFDWSVGILFNSKVEGEYILQHLINGMERYRRACWLIPITSRSANESAAAYEKRCQAIISLAGEYEYAMMSLDKFSKGNIQGLPPELHDRYREWKKSIPACPREKEIRNRLNDMRKLQ